MKLRSILEHLAGAFEREQVDYALIGGMALGFLGIIRSTVDLDFLVHRDHLPAIDRIMSLMGYRRAFRSENVSQYAASAPGDGEVDFLHAFRQASRRMLREARSFPLPGTSLRLKVARPEDLIGLKVQALVNAPHRAARDGEDIRQLLIRYRDELDGELVREYFAIFNRLDLLAQLEDSLDEAE